MNMIQFNLQKFLIKKEIKEIEESFFFYDFLKILKKNLFDNYNLNFCKSFHNKGVESQNDLEL